jgi:hypothetical protein
VDAAGTKKADEKSAFFIDNDSNFQDRKDGSFSRKELKQKSLPYLRMVGFFIKHQ